MQSLMQLCVTNMQQKEELEEELEGAKEILKKTLCSDCKDSLKTGTKCQKKKSAGITVRGKGNAFIMSLLAVRVALVAVYAPGQVGP